MPQGGVMCCFSPFGRKLQRAMTVRVYEPVFPQTLYGLRDRRRRNLKPLG